MNVFELIGDSIESLNSSYTFMNMYGATFASYVVALYYIKKLEEELKKLRTKK